MAAAREQAQERRIDGLGCEEQRGDVAVQVVHGHEREAPPPRERLRRRQPHQERADQARPARHGDARNTLEVGARLPQGLADDRHHELQVTARGDLGDDAAIARVQLGL